MIKRNASGKVLHEMVRAGMMPARYCAPGKARAPVRSVKGLNKAMTIL